MYQKFIPPGQHKLPPLPYPTNALEPIISEEALRIHHDILHRGYVERLNQAELNLVAVRRNRDYQYLKYWENELAFTGSGHILHSIYWTTMAPFNQTGQPGPHTLTQINAYFGNFNSFQEQFTNAALQVEGSGWVILTWQPTWGHLEIHQAEKHQNLTQWSGVPVLLVDVWEHAYYLEYQNKRGEFINNWWQLVNWHEVERRLMLAQSGVVPIF